MTRISKPDERRHISPRKHKNPYKTYHAPAHSAHEAFRVHANVLPADSAIYAFIPNLSKTK